MERLTIPDVRIDKNTIRRSIIDAEKVKECAMKIYWRLKSIEDAVADAESEEYDLDRLRELVKADRAKRIKVLPEATGQVCGTCANFQREEGRKSGTCKVKKFFTDRWGRVDKMRGQFTTAQSRKACAKYEPEKPPSLAEEVRDRFFCKSYWSCKEYCSKCCSYGECYACASCGMPDRCQLCERYYTKEQLEKIRSGEANGYGE